MRLPRGVRAVRSREGCANPAATFAAASQRSSVRCSYPRPSTFLRIQAPKLCHGPRSPCPVASSDVPCGSGTIGATQRQLFDLNFASVTSRSPRRAKSLSRRGRDGLDAAKTGGIEGQDYHLPALRPHPRWFAPYRPSTGRSSWTEVSHRWWPISRQFLGHSESFRVRYPVPDNSLA